MNQYMMIETPKSAEYSMNSLLFALANDKSLDIEISIHREKRSLNANAAMWAMLGRMAEVLQTTADELYIEELRNYGVSDFIVCVPGNVERISKQFSWTEERGSRFINGVEMTVLQVWLGSSTYNTKQFARLLDGIINDAKEIDVEFISSQERDLLLAEWERTNGS